MCTIVDWCPFGSLWRNCWSLMDSAPENRSGTWTPASSWALPDPPLDSIDSRFPPIATKSYRHQGSGSESKGKSAGRRPRNFGNFYRRRIQDLFDFRHFPEILDFRHFPGLLGGRSASFGLSQNIDSKSDRRLFFHPKCTGGRFFRCNLPNKESKLDRRTNQCIESVPGPPWWFLWAVANRPAFCRRPGNFPANGSRNFPERNRSDLAAEELKNFQMMKKRVLWVQREKNQALAGFQKRSIEVLIKYFYSKQSIFLVKHPGHNLRSESNPT